MTNDTLSLDVQLREETGKKLKSLRRQGFVPASIQKDGAEPKLIMIDKQALDRIYAKAGMRHPINLMLDKGSQLSVIKEVEKVPAKGTLLHVVFQGIKANQKITADVPVEFIEIEIPAEQAGLIVLKVLEQVSVEALPGDMPDKLEIDPSSLKEAGQKLLVSDIIVPKGVTVLTESDETFVVVEEPRVTEESEVTAEDTESEVPSEHGDKSDDNVGEPKE